MVAPNQARGAMPRSGPSPEKPPSPGISTPVIHDAASEARKATALPTSLPSPPRPSGWNGAATASGARGHPRLKDSMAGDQVQAGETASARLPRGASVTANFFATNSSAALAPG